LGSSYAAFLPSIASTATRIEGHAGQQVAQNALLNQSGHAISLNNSLDLDWVFYDGGKRLASLESARDLLVSQQAAHDATLLNVFSATVQQFFQVTASEATVVAKEEAERNALKSYQVADGRNKGGIAPLSDVLQARTALGQATLDRINAEGALAQQKGQLAVKIGLTANASITFVPSQAPVPTLADLGHVDMLVKEAEKIHPSILAAAAQLKSQQAQIDVAASEGLPVVSLTGNVTVGRYTGQYLQPLPVTQTQDTWGVQIQIPLSSGPDRGYQIRLAQANAAEARGELENAELQVSLNVWSSYQSLQADIHALETARDLLTTAKRSYAVTLGRYENGIGSILDLIDAQTTLASANQQMIQITAACLSDRANLTASLGKLDLSIE